MGTFTNKRKMILNQKHYEVWLEIHLPELDIDEVGQINFVPTGFKDNQKARLKIQAIFDKKYYRVEG